VLLSYSKRRITGLCRIQRGELWVPRGFRSITRNVASSCKSTDISPGPKYFVHGQKCSPDSGGNILYVIGTDDGFHASSFAKFSV
jgi:hypothetical protein